MEGVFIANYSSGFPIFFPFILEASFQTAPYTEM